MTGRFLHFWISQIARLRAMDEFARLWDANMLQISEVGWSFSLGSIPCSVGHNGSLIRFRHCSAIKEKMFFNLYPEKFDLAHASARTACRDLTPLSPVRWVGCVGPSRQRSCGCGRTHTGHSGCTSQSAGHRPFNGVTRSATTAATSRPRASQWAHRGCSRRKAARTTRHAADW